MIKMEALERFSYDGKDLEPGDPFTVSESEHARLLSIVGRAKIIEEDNAAEAQPAKGDEPQGKSNSRREYNRRDLTAKH